MMRYTSSDGLMSSTDPARVAQWEEIATRHESEQAKWTALLREIGVKLAHPDDGWVQRDRNIFNLSWYPRFNDQPQVGDLIAFGKPPRPTRWDPTGSFYEPSRVWDGREHKREIASPEVAMSGYRLCRVTEVDDRTGILGRLVTYHYEDTGQRIPERRPLSPWWRRLLPGGEQ